MKTIKSINNKEIAKRLNNESYYDFDDFVKDCKRYISALKAGRLLASIKTVSSSGMSRTFSLDEMAKGNSGKFVINTFTVFMRCLGYRINKDGNICVTGCGMDMIFATNYEICRILKGLGVISEKECKALSQETIHRI